MQDKTLAATGPASSIQMLTQLPTGWGIKLTKGEDGFWVHIATPGGQHFGVALVDIRPLHFADKGLSAFIEAQNAKLAEGTIQHLAGHQLNDARIEHQDLEYTPGLFEADLQEPQRADHKPEAREAAGGKTY